MPPPEITPNPDADLLADEPPEAMSNHAGYFQRAEEELIRELGPIYGKIGDLQATPGYVPGRFIMKAIKCSSWASHEDIRNIRWRMIAATLRSGQRIVDASTAGAHKLVDEIGAMKRASDDAAKQLVGATKWLAIGTWILAVATIGLVLVEKFKH
jgi:hypothetical protein